MGARQLEVLYTCHLIIAFKHHIPKQTTKTSNMANIIMANIKEGEDHFEAAQQEGSTYNPAAGEAFDKGLSVPGYGSNGPKNHHEGGAGISILRLNINKPKRSTLGTAYGNLNTLTSTRDASVVPRHISCTNLINASTIDLRKGQFIYPETTVHANTLIGVCQILLPPGVRVVKAGYGIFGAFRDHTDKLGNSKLTDGPVIRVVGAQTFGYTSIEVDLNVPPVKMI